MLFSDPILVSEFLLDSGLRLGEICAETTRNGLKFVIAAYNVGIAHVYDAIALAKKYNLDPQRWDGNVEKAILMKMNPKYYNDPVTRYGYCRGTETVAYVKRITDFYEHARREISA